MGPALEEEPDDVDAELKEEDEEDDEEEEDEEQKENDVQTTIQELQAAFGPYTPEAGWSILPTLASSQEAFDQMDLKKYFSADKKGAFLWDDGWDTGTYKSSMKAKGRLRALLLLQYNERTMVVRARPRHLRLREIVGCAQTRQRKTQSRIYCDVISCNSGPAHTHAHTQYYVRRRAEIIN